MGKRQRSSCQRHNGSLAEFGGWRAEKRWQSQRSCRKQDSTHAPAGGVSMFYLQNEDSICIHYLRVSLGNMAGVLNSELAFSMTIWREFTEIGLDFERQGSQPCSYSLEMVGLPAQKFQIKSRCLPAEVVMVSLRRLSLVIGGSLPLFAVQTCHDSFLTMMESPRCRFRSLKSNSTRFR